MMMNSKNPLLLIACSLKQTKRELSFPRIGAAGPPQSVVVTMRRDPEGLFGHNTPERRTVRFMRDIVAVLLLAVVGVASAMAEVPERARADIDRIIRDKGTYAADEGVYKVVLPREAATIVQDSQTLSPNVGLNSWAAFISGVHHEAVLTGQLLLLEDEVDTVLPAALDAGLQVTGLADSSLFAGPRLEVLDVAGVGTYQGLASSFRKALDAIQRRRISTPRPVEKLPELSLDSSINPEPLNAILSMRGSVSQGVYRAAIGHGEFVTRPDELQKLLKALISRNIRVVSIRNHMVGEHPEFLFVRFWQQGRSVEVARGVRYALDVQVGAIATERSASQ